MFFLVSAWWKYSSNNKQIINQGLKEPPLMENTGWWDIVNWWPGPNFTCNLAFALCGVRPPKTNFPEIERLREFGDHFPCVGANQRILAHVYSYLLPIYLAFFWIQKDQKRWSDSDSIIPYESVGPLPSCFFPATFQTQTRRLQLFSVGNRWPYFFKELNSRIGVGIFTWFSKRIDCFE